jgi:hypothetical protein
MSKLRALGLIALLVGALAPAIAAAEDKAEQRTAEERIQALEQRVAQLESSIEHKSSVAFAAFLYGVFCALWAQNTGRSAWLWFFLGLLFSVITVIVLLVKTSNDRKRLRQAVDEEPVAAGVGEEPGRRR